MVIFQIPWTSSFPPREGVAEHFVIPAFPSSFLRKQESRCWFNWIPACAGMTRAYQQRCNLNSGTSQKITPCFALCDTLQKEAVAEHFVIPAFPSSFLRKQESRCWFDWIPAFAGMTRAYQQRWNLNSGTSQKMTPCFALCDTLQEGGNEEHSTIIHRHH